MKSHTKYDLDLDLEKFTQEQNVWNISIKENCQRWRWKSTKMQIQNVKVKVKVEQKVKFT